MIEKHTPTPEQEHAIALTLAEVGPSNGSIIADEMGYGKTTMGAEIITRGIREHGWGRVLLIALPNTHKAWAERITAQADGEIEPIILDGTTQGRENMRAFMSHKPGVYIGGSAYLQDKDWTSKPVTDHEGLPIYKIDKQTGMTMLKDGEPVQETKSVRTHYYDRFSRKPLDAVLFDEVQAIANRRAKGRQTILSIKSGFRVALSGTWFNNKLENQWSIARWVWPDSKPDGTPYVDTSFHRWSARYLTSEIVTSKSGREVTDSRGNVQRKVTGEKIPGEFAASLPCYIRRENEDRVPQAKVIYVDPSPEQSRQLKELEADLITWVRNHDGGEMPLVVDIPVVLRTRLRQTTTAALSIEGVFPDERVVMHDDAESAKLAPLRYLLEERWKGERAAIYTDSKIGAHFITARLRRAGVDARAWTGDLSKKQREELKAAYLAGEFPYIVCTIPSFGTGIDGFQKVCNKVAWISHADGNPSLNDQAIARFFRPGRLISDPSDPHGGFEHVRILMSGSLDTTSLEHMLDQAWKMRAALNQGLVSA